jgi:hypothetical protein
MSDKGLGPVAAYLCQFWQAIKFVLWPAICNRAVFAFYEEELVEQDDGSMLEVHYHTVCVWR